MKKLIRYSAASLLLVTSAASLAFANDTGIRASQVRANKIIGTTVYDRDNQNVGTVKDLILDKGGKVDEVVLNYGSTLGMGGKYVAISFADFKFDNNRLTVDDSKARLDALPAYKLEDENTGAGEGAVPANGGHANGPD